ncbi:MAG: hypothetical protein J3Q66DRAFT_342329 [Benniella sp.]|nr:MAG: hypothetical protein J3Q66DRAFT_342329 [Benniella sp.]
MPPAGLKVLISGGGIAGLTLAVLLERAGIEYEVFERASTVRQLGSALSIGPSVLPMIEQLGLMEKFQEVSKVSGVVSNFNEELQVTSTVSYIELLGRTGYPNYVTPRPRFYDLLYSQIPKEKVHMNKRAESIEQDDKDDGQVTITFTDKTTAQGHILVGADGAYSGIRQLLYNKLDQQGKLPLSDKEELPCSSICLVGQTRPLSTDKFPYLLEKYCRMEIVSGKNKPYTWMTLCMPDNTICWMVVEHLYLETNRSEIIRNAEWGPGSTDAMIEKVKGFPIPSGAEGLTLADIIDETPRELISQVALEGKFFETWYSGRTVLIGDACHKMYPTATQGANTAIQDAIVLANYIHHMADTKIETITTAFQGYYQERVGSARQAYETSDRFRQIFRKRFINSIIRFILKYIPQFVWNRAFDRLYSNRPQIAFLPLIPDRGVIKALSQRSLHLNESSLSSSPPSS